MAITECCCDFGQESIIKFQTSDISKLIIKICNFFCSLQKMEGQLSKFTNLVKGWQFRWFVLDPDSGTLTYYLVNIKQ